MTVYARVKQTLAGLGSARATLNIYAAQSQSTEAKSAFKEAVAVTGEIMDGIEQRLKALEFEEPQYKGL